MSKKDMDIGLEELVNVLIAIVLRGQPIVNNLVADVKPGPASSLEDVAIVSPVRGRGRGRIGQLEVDVADDNESDGDAPRGEFDGEVDGGMYVALQGDGEEDGVEPPGREAVIHGDRRSEGFDDNPLYHFGKKP
ncbi:hypothetical protein MLD38_016168 [Melastoma candidum]|uniref:Uncharacterized protein n=1 Tax=Melastoma candidum TaxID=119954 RepID=A0ACB9RIQ0_9MYRT|nr:hypothetical protein MLD38_016168 [Melastoma candidum]